MTITLIGYLIDEFLRCARENKNRDFVPLLEKSLKQADNAAKDHLHHLLYQALQWPRTLDAYVEYLCEFARWIPKQSTDPAWTKPGTDDNQEVYDRLCHFYWLIDQKAGPEGRIVENLPWFKEWLVRYADAWGSFLNTTESFNHETLQSFIKSPKYEVENSMIGKPPYWRSNEPSGWLTFNQFFARELNSGLRPIDFPTDNHVVTSPADCTFRATYPIDADSNVIDQNSNAKKTIRLKKTHAIGNVKDLLECSPHKDKFAKGRFVHYFLSPYSYHRFHMPVAGRVLECRPVQGLTYLDVNIPVEGPNKGQFDAPDSAEGGYQFAQSRGVVIVNTTGSPFGDIGLVAIVPVGMAQVSSVNMTMIPNSDALKGDEFGYFLFGGSDIIMLFQEKAKVKIDQSTSYRRYGTSISSPPPSS